MASRRRALTLPEVVAILVGVGILAAVFGASTNRARDRAMTVKCQVNLRNFYQGEQIYAVTFNGTAMPYKTTPAPAKPADGYWYGDVLMGAMIKKAGGGPVAAVTLWCPTNAGGNFKTQPSGYAYNGNFGDESNAANLAANPIKKMSEIRRDTLMFIEDHPAADAGDHDYYFKNATDLFVYDNQPLNIADSHGKSPLAGHPHENQAKGNMLLADGRIITDDPFKMNTTAGVPQPTNAPNGVAGTDYLYVADPFANKPTLPLPFK